MIKFQTLFNKQGKNYNIFTMNNTLIYTLIAIGSLVLFILLVSSLASFYAYRKIWMGRSHEINDPVKYSYEDIKGYSLRTPIIFKFKKTHDLDKSLRGFIYSPIDKSTIKRPLIVMAIGWGRTHLSYLLDIKILNQAGYQVITYDQFGTGASGGKSQRGMHFGMYSLNMVLDQLNDYEDFKNRPIYLYGHSWGGYCVLSVLDRHPEIKKVVARSPVGKPVLSSYLYGGKSIGFPMTMYLYGCVAPLLLLRYGPKIYKKSQDSVEKNHTTNILITSCTQDPTVHDKASVIPYLKKHKQDNVNIYIRDDIHIHNDILTKEGYEYFTDKLKEYDKLTKDKSIGYKERIDSFLQSLDKSKITTDDKEINTILDFLNN